jgi:hypothetical protein
MGSTSWMYDVRCDTCGSTGTIVWSEWGAFDQHEGVTAIWGDFKEVADPDHRVWSSNHRRGMIVCCDTKPESSNHQRGHASEEYREWRCR